MKLTQRIIILQICLTSLNADTDFDLMSTLSLDEMMELSISTSTGTKKPISLAPSIATIITDKDIAHSSAKTVNEILEKVPGLHVYTSAAQYQSSNFDIRGIHTKFNPQIMMLLNGTSIQMLKLGKTMSFFDFPLSAVKRIEIVRGPGSVIYGANAFSGVVNIITKDAEYLTDNSSSGIRYGSFNTNEVWLNYGKTEDKFSYSFNFSASSSDGDDGRIFRKDLQSLLDPLFSTNASIAPNSLNSEHKRYNLNINAEKGNFKINFWAHANRDVGTGAGIANALDPTGYGESSRVQTDIYYKKVFNQEYKLEHKLALSYQKTESYLHVFPPNTTLAIGTDGNFGGKPVAGIVNFPDGYIGTPGEIEKTASFESTLMVDKYKNHSIRLNAGFSYAKYNPIESKNFGPGIIDGTEGVVNGTLTVANTNAIYMPNVNRKIFFISAQDEWNFSPKWSLTSGVRYDNFSDVGQTINPRLALVWQTSKVLTTKLLYGSAFRAPSFVELYAQNNPVGNGNKNIKSETIDTFELAFDYYPTNKVRSIVDFYYYKAKELIDSKGNSLDNIGSQSGYGIELEVNYQPISELTLKADYTYSQATDKATDLDVADTPKHLAHTEIDWKFSKNCYINTELFWVAKRVRAVDDTRANIKDYTTANTSVTYILNKNITLNASIRNIFDKKFYEPSPSQGALGELDDYQSQGRYAFLEIKYNF